MDTMAQSAQELYLKERRESKNPGTEAPFDESPCRAIESGQK